MCKKFVKNSQPFGKNVWKPQGGGHFLSHTVVLCFCVCLFCLNLPVVCGIYSDAFMMSSKLYCLSMYFISGDSVLYCVWKVADLVATRDINVTRAETCVFACNRRSYPGGVWHVVSQVNASHGCKVLTLRSVLQVTCDLCSIHVLCALFIL